MILARHRDGAISPCFGSQRSLSPRSGSADMRHFKASRRYSHSRWRSRQWWLTACFGRRQAVTAVSYCGLASVLDPESGPFKLYFFAKRTTKSLFIVSLMLAAFGQVMFVGNLDRNQKKMNIKLYANCICVPGYELLSTIYLLQLVCMFLYLWVQHGMLTQSSLSSEPHKIYGGWPRQF